MKQLLLLAFLCCASAANAQDWAAVRLTDQYNFDVIGQVYLPFFDSSYTLANNCIWVDSFDTNNGDSIFYLNRFVELVSPDTLVRTKNFAQKQCIRRSGGLYVFAQPDTFFLYTQAQTQDQWAFTPDSTIWATVDSITLDSLMNGAVVDSVKHISLSNGKLLKLSKQHGFVLFPDLYNSHQYALSGIQGSRVVGESLDNWQDYFDYEVGDVFMYTRIEGFYWEHCYIKTEILSKTITPDSTTYTSRTIQQCSTIPSTPFWWLGQESFATITCSAAWCGWDIHKMANIKSFGMIPTSCYSDYLAYPVYVNHEGEKLKIIQNNNLGATPNPNIYTVEPGYIFCSLKKGIGYIRYSYDCHESFGQTYLTGYYHAATGDTLGYLLDDGYLLAEEKISSNEVIFSIVPNPAQDHFYINAGNDVAAYPLEVNVYNLSGMRVLAGICASSGSPFYTTNLPAGLYMVELKNAQKTTVLKLQVGH